MNFTREPIIETIITPKDGYKLIVRNSKGGGQEEYSVDAIEVVSFGHSFFFRSLERPKSFLVPVSDYEVVETKETRVVLKNVNVERSIKIGGGREASGKAPKEHPPERAPEAVPESEEEFEEQQPSSAEAGSQQHADRKRDRRRHRRRRGGMEDRQETREWPSKSKPSSESSSSSQGGEKTEAAHAEKGGETHDETPVSSPSFTTLFPPPSTLISETIGRYKDQAFSEGHLSSKKVEDSSSHEKKKHEKKEDENNSFGEEGTHLSRTRASETEMTDFHVQTPIVDEHHF